MAAEETSTSAIVRWDDARADYCRGTKEELIAAGICKARWFPKKLVPELRKDGQPYRGNNGQQRLKRTYRVANSSPETEMWHRRDAYGNEFWIVRMALAETEVARRKEEESRKAEFSAREYEERCRKREDEVARAREAARPTVERLRSRYPALIRIDGEINTREDRTRLQCLTFYAREVEILTRYGLVTEEMLSVPLNRTYRSGDLRSGGSFFLSCAKDSRGAGYCYVTLRTEETPRERKYFPVTDAKSILKVIARRPDHG